MITFMRDIKTIRWQLGGVSQADAAKICGVNIRTFRRWESGETEPPEMAVKLLSVIAAGCLEHISPEWSGWRIIDDQLVDPENRVYSQQWFGRMHFSFQKQQGERAEMRNKIRYLESENKKLREILPKMATVIKFPGN